MLASKREATVISTGPVAAEWSVIIRRPVVTRRYVTGVTNIVRKNRRAIGICELECAGLIVGVAGMHRHDKALGSRQSSMIPSGVVAGLYLPLVDGEERGLGAGLLQRPARLLELDALDPVGGEDGDLAPL